MFWKEFALLALLIVFYCIIYSMITFHFIALIIEFSKELLENDFLQE